MNSNVKKMLVLFDIKIIEDGWKRQAPAPIRRGGGGGSHYILYLPLKASPYKLFIMKGTHYSYKIQKEKNC